MNEDAPTMSVGNGGFTGSAAPTGPNAGVDPLMSAKVKRRKFKPKGHVIKNIGIGEAVEDKGGYYPFKVCYDGAESYVLYSKSEATLKIELRKMYRPENFKKIYVTRLYPNEVVKFYWNKRQAALRV
jgi:hypothetical protein|tara:strand:- start:159 stop:539 length:381 start_codon:yes stop_codon:yes gene_type:complete